MNSFVQLDKKEWDSFLEKLSELESKYELVLRELDQARSRLEALDKSLSRKEKHPLNPTAPTQSHPTQRTTLPKKPRLETKLQSPLTPPANQTLMDSTAPPNYASCSRCGSKIIRATRFCEVCGANFGKLVCSCGRALSESVRFCDHCGRRVEDTS